MHTVNHHYVLRLRSPGQLHGQMAHWSQWAYLLAWELEAEQREREREIIASGCCNSSCWYDSRHEHNEDLAAKRITHILDRRRNAKDLMICFNKCVVSRVSRRQVKLSWILFFSIIQRDVFCDFVDFATQSMLHGPGALVSLGVRNAECYAPPQTHWCRFCIFNKIPWWLACTLGSRSIGGKQSQIVVLGQ